MSLYRFSLVVFGIGLVAWSALVALLVIGVVQ